MTDNPHNCRNCDRHSTCNSPCDKVESILDGTQTHKENRKALPYDFVRQRQSDPFRETAPVGQLKRMIIKMYFTDKRRKCDITRMTGATEQYVYRVIKKEKEKRDGHI